MWRRDEPEPSQQRRQGYVLVVGPDVRERVHLESLLEGAGFDVLASDEAEVLEAFDLERPRLVVIDDAQSAPDRLATLQRIDTHPPLEGAPILVLAPDTDIDSYTNALTRGAAAYLAKPVADEALVAAATKLHAWSPPDPDANTRKRRRRPLLMGVDVAAPGRDLTLQGQMVEASSGGCRVEVPQRLERGDRLRIVLHTPGASIHVALGAEVRWCTEGAAGDFVCGCQFNGSTAIVAARLLGFVSSWDDTAG